MPKAFLMSLNQNTNRIIGISVVDVNLSVNVANFQRKPVKIYGYGGLFAKITSISTTAAMRFRHFTSDEDQI